MPGNRKITKKTIKGRENVHPGSRKANQLNRVQLRTTKLQHQAKTRKDLVSAKLHRPVFFLHSLPSPHALSLPSLRALVSSVYLARHDARMAELEGDRRPGRPKAKELLELEEVKKREQSEWETGIEVPDLTHAPTVKFLYSLVETNAPLRVSHLDILRQVRLFKDDPELVLVTREGNASRMGLIGEDDIVEEGPDWTDGVVEEIPMEVEK